MNRIAGERPRFLYLYDIEDWAIHEVGRSWLALLDGQVEFEFLSLARARASLAPGDLAGYTDTIAGFSSMIDGQAWRGVESLRDWRRVVGAMARESRYWLGHREHPGPLDERFRRGLAVVHDPIELFPQREQWRRFPPSYSRLRRFRRIATVSDELTAALARLRRDIYRISTRPSVAVRASSALSELPARPLSVCAEHPRKNLPLLRELARSWDEHAAPGEGFDLQVGITGRSREDYVRLLDARSIYVCASWQEGGPLPVMEAVCRGLAVITSPVGQTNLWVHHGRNGYVCRTPAEFERALQSLRDDPATLMRMRRESLAVAAQRSLDPVREQLLAFLGIGDRGES